MSSITIYWKPVPNVPGEWHEFLLYDDGMGNVQYKRGGPEHTDPIPNGFGKIETEHGDYREGTPDYLHHRGIGPGQ